MENLNFKLIKCFFNYKFNWLIPLKINNDFFREILKNILKKSQKIYKK